MRTIFATEDQIHKAFIQYVTLKYPNDSGYLIHIPNEGKRSWAEGKRQKTLGLRKGVFDLFFAKPSYAHHGLWIELKSAKGKPTREQLQFEEDIQRVGYLACIVNSLEDAIRVFETYIRNSHA